MLIIRNARKSDISVIVSIHLNAFPRFFLSQLGSRFLTLYYNSVREQDKGILLTCELDGEVIGLCAGTLLSSGFNAKLIKADLFHYGIESLRLLVTAPQSLLHLMKNMKKENSKEGDDGNYAELLSIAVNPKVQRSGAGKAMLSALEEEVKRREGKRLSLTTDYEDNDNALGFYKSLGYEIWYDFITYPQRRMYRLIKEL